jgi:tellurite resistance protein TerC
MDRDRVLAVSLRTARRVVVGVVGATVVAVGALLLVLPGPAMLVIPIGLAILAIEFQWARRWLRRIRNAVARPPVVEEGLTSTRRE